MSNRALAKLTQPAVGEFLQRKQDEALRKLADAEVLARSVRHAPTKAKEIAREKQLDAIAVASEWGLVGSECR